MEEAPTKESIPDIQIDAVLEALTTNGPEHEASRGLLLAWIEQEERKIQDDPRNKRLSAAFNFCRADIYLVVGDREGAIECLEQVLQQTQGEGFEDVYQQGLMLLKTIEASN